MMIPSKMPKILFLLIAVFLCALRLSAQDVITLHTGEEIKGKVIEVGVSEVKYQKDGRETPVYVISKADVRTITYENGAKDEFKYVPPDTRLRPEASYSYQQLLVLSERYKRKGIIITSIGGGMIISGGFMIVTSIASPLTQNDGVLPYVGTMCILGSIPFLIIGPIQLGKFARYRRMGYDKRPEISLEPSSSGLKLKF